MQPSTIQPGVTQASFLIGLTIDHLKSQYGMNYVPSDFECKYIPNNQESYKAFEVFNIASNNVTNVRFYVQRSSISSFDRLRLENEFGVSEFTLEPLAFNGQMDEVQINNPLQYVFAASIFLNTAFFQLPTGTIYAESYVPPNVKQVQNTTTHTLLADSNYILTLGDGSAILVNP